MSDIKRTKSIKRGDKRKHRSLKKKNCSSRLMCTVVFLKESDTSLWLDKINFSNEPKLTEVAKQKHCVNTIHTNRCMTFDMSFVTPKSTALKQTFLQNTAYNDLP